MVVLRRMLAISQPTLPAYYIALSRNRAIQTTLVRHEAAAWPALRGRSSGGKRLFADQMRLEGITAE
jgi:hypothetical protein